jgi:hypothetical protein
MKHLLNGRLMMYFIFFKGGKTMAKDVLCEVNNCSYWGQGNKCQADAIYVVSHTGKKAGSSEETDCKTFEPADL